ncbi:hypothetical protein [Budvicia aquatica]|uniref:Uncharacterized protein n=1 Tax=Budvicia aquatica TaxID=82979 RepID=A0A2C6DQG7_9GAMM|nr:hypothetical protein [Budvicia aquatica]PHI31061.1 hypothetical protein CRN84_17845 [Budvicia aquatica]VFS51279.1 Uncharacterised protein [Budvicia aquatica]
MTKQEIKQLNDILQKSQQASAIARAMYHSWLELPGCEIELLIGMFSEYSDSVTECLINLSGEAVRHG